MMELPRVAIGGVGGSGTRIVARVVRRLGYDLGGDLNPSEDNLLFTLLFRRPRWYRRVVREHRESEIFWLLDLFYRLMRGGEISVAELERLDDIHAEGEFESFERAEPAWYANRREALLRSSEHVEKERALVGWGWKEPNSHIYIPQLREQDDQLKYIHVIRNGLDMAFSSNQAQLRMWGHLVDVEPPEGSEGVEVASLDYWIRINRRSIQLAEELFGDRFLLVHFDRLVREPEIDVSRIMGFLGAEGDVADLSREIEEPASVGRHRQHDLDRFRPDQIEAVRSLGFDVD